MVQSSYESGIKELSQEFRIRLQDEITIRKGVERQLEKQNSLKKQMEMNIDHLKEDNGDKQATIALLKVQLEDIKCINLEMYTKLADIQEHCPHCSRELCRLNQTKPNQQIFTLKHSKSGTEVSRQEPQVLLEEKLRQVVKSPTFHEAQQDRELERFVFSFYVQISRDKSQEENIVELRGQLESIEELTSINLIYFKRYFSRLQFNEVVIDFTTNYANKWKNEPKSIMRNLSGYNDAYKFSQLKLENLNP